MLVYCVPCKSLKPASEFQLSRVRNIDTSPRSSCRQCLRDRYREKNRERNKLYRKSRPEWVRQMRDRANTADRLKSTPESYRADRLRKQYRMSIADYDRMFTAQKGLCAICGNSQDWKGRTLLNVDHCHDTGKVRGLLCHHCNTALGLMRDDVTRLQSAIIYLTQSRRTDT